LVKWFAVLPKYMVASLIGFLKGKIAIGVTRVLGGKDCNSTGEQL